MKAFKHILPSNMKDPNIWGELLLDEFMGTIITNNAFIPCLAVLGKEGKDLVQVLTSFPLTSNHLIPEFFRELITGLPQVKLLGIFAFSMFEIKNPEGDSSGVIVVQQGPVNNLSFRAFRPTSETKSTAWEDVFPDIFPFPHQDLFRVEIPKNLLSI